MCGENQRTLKFQIQKGTGKSSSPLTSSAPLQALIPQPLEPEWGLLGTLEGLKPLGEGHTSPDFIPSFPTFP